MPSDNAPTNTNDPEDQDKQPGWQRLNTESVRRLEDLAYERVGKTLAGRFQLKRMLAIGGMATVYEAIQSPLMRRVAVKILHPTEIEAGRSEYFLREANAAAALRHPNIISIVDFGKEDDGTLFLAMEYVPGLTFSELLAQEYPLPHGRLIHIMEQVCLALEVAHRAGVVHCDMKPGNIMIESVPGNADHVKVLDFGISRHVVAGHTQVEQDDEEIIGSYFYMAPEQILGRQVSARTDVYGLGVVLYTSLTAAFPFDERDDQALMEAILRTDPLPPSLVRPELNIPVAFDAILTRALAKDPQERFATCAAFRKALLNLRQNPNTLSSSHDDAPHSLEILLPEDELFEIEVDMENSEAEEEIIPGALEPEDLPEFLPYDPIIPLLPELLTPPELPRIDPPLAMLDKPIPSLLSGRSPIIGRSFQLAELKRAALMTRRGAVTINLSGRFGCGSSFFLSRGLEALVTDLGATILLQGFRADAREYPFRGLHDLVCSGLDDFTPYERSEGSSLIATALLEHRCKALRSLDMGRLETRALEHLLDRWSDPQGTRTSNLLNPDSRPYSSGPLRFPETRAQVLTHAFAELMRALVVHGRETSVGERHHRTALVLAIDGWEFCDSPTRQVIRQVLSEHRHLPLLFIAVSHPDANSDGESFPEEVGDAHLVPDSDGHGWDMSLEIPPFTIKEVEQVLTEQLGQKPSGNLVERVASYSGGNPLFIKELLNLSSLSSLSEGELPSVPIPDSPARLFAHQIEGLSRDGKMLLAVCTLLGPTFPVAPVHVIMPSEFDVNGTLAELMGARVLEPVGDNTRLRFRFPKMRETALRRLHPRLRQGLHARIVKLLLAQNLPIGRNEAEIWLAVHSLKSGDPLSALDHLLEAAESALDRWEPELTLRRCRQTQLWIAACLARQQTSSDILVLGAPDPDVVGDNALSIDEDIIDKAPPRSLEARGMRALKIILSASRRLQLKPERSPRAVISDRLPQQFFDQVRLHSHQPAKLRAEAAFELGRYFSRLELPQSARTAFQLAHQLGQRSGDDAFILLIELELVRNLHRLGKQGQASDLANSLMERIRALGPKQERPHELSLAKPLDQLAKIYIGRRLFPRAEHYLDQARAIAENDLDHDQLCKIYLHYAALYRTQNQHRRTLQALRKANEVAVKSDDLRSQARVLYNLGITSANLGKRTEGRRYLSEAIEVAISLGWTDFIGLVNGQIKKL